MAVKTIGRISPDARYWWRRQKDKKMFGNVDNKGNRHRSGFDDPVLVIHACAIIYCPGKDCATCFYGPNGDGRKSVCERVRETLEGEFGNNR